MPKVSVILSTYNGSKFIGRAIESVLNQNFQDFELIIIDDGSTDNTFQIINQWAKKDKRIIILKNEKNLGVPKSLNRGLKVAKGEYVALIDDDDEWIDKDKIKKQVEFLEQNHSYVLVGTKTIAVDKNNQELYRIDQAGQDELIRKKMFLNNYFIQSSILFRKDIILKFGGYSENEKERYVEDYDIVLKLGTVGKVAILDFYGVKFVHHHRLSRSHKIDQLKKSLSLIKKYRQNYPFYFKALLIKFFGLILYGYLNFPLLKVLKNKFFAKK